MKSLLPCVLSLSLGCSLVLAREAKPDVEEVSRAVVENYARLVHANYQDALLAGQDLEKAIEKFVAAPTPEGLEKAKESWIAARLPYLQTEAFRFYSGPIDDEGGPEPLLNAWPMDEYHVDYVEGAPQAGIIGNGKDYPVITKELIEELNEKDGETAITTGYHAIEFLLWGQDQSETGPGNRPYTDYTTAPNAERRGTYLKVAVELLTDHLSLLVEAWKPGVEDNYRAGFEKRPPVEAARLIVTGLHFLSGKELAGERLTVALETQNQEDEHSCFSDCTHLDTIYDVKGMQNVYHGTYTTLAGEKISGPGVRNLIEVLSPGQLAGFDAKMTEALAAAEAIPVPFDQAILGDDEAPGRKAILKAIQIFEDTAELLLEVDSHLARAAGE